MCFISDIDVCRNNPCVGGTCESVHGQFFCDCPDNIGPTCGTGISNSHDI